MTCACCNRPRPLEPPIIGIQRGLDDAPALILWNCPCGTTRAIRWSDATVEERKRAHLAQLSVDAASEMMWRRE